jgi:hypothetical protein
MPSSDTYFPPNNCANPNGRPLKKNSIREQLRFIIGLKPGDEPSTPFSHAQKLAIERIKECESGSLESKRRCDAIDNLTNQVDGSPQQSVEVKGDAFTATFNAWRQADDDEKGGK